MYITLETDYAIRIVDCLAINYTENGGHGKLGANIIAERTGVTFRFALKILRKLVSEGIVCSFRGAYGGYGLAKKPDEITLGEIIGAIEGRYFLSRCLRKGHTCTNTKIDNNANCPYHCFFEEISRQIQQKFDAVTIADLTTPKTSDATDTAANRR